MNTAPKLEDAKRMKREYESRRDAGMLVAMDYTFSEWADFWFEHHKNRVSVTTQEGYSYTLRNLKAYYGRRKLSEIRHTYVTHMLALGVDPKTVQALVGHAEIDMTMYYAHAQETSKQDAISRYDDAFSAPGGGLYGNVIKLVKSG